MDYISNWRQASRINKGIEMECNECAVVSFSDRLHKVEIESSRMMEALEGIKSNTDELVNFSRQQVRMEERQIAHGQSLDRAFEAIKQCHDDSNKRLELIEQEIPTLVLARKCVFGSVVWLVGMTGAMAWALIFK